MVGDEEGTFADWGGEVGVVGYYYWLVAAVAAATATVGSSFLLEEEFSFKVSCPGDRVHGPTGESDSDVSVRYLLIDEYETRFTPVVAQIEPSPEKGSQFLSMKQRTLMRSRRRREIRLDWAPPFLCLRPPR